MRVIQVLAECGCGCSRWSPRVGAYVLDHIDAIRVIGGVAGPSRRAYVCVFAIDHQHRKGRCIFHSGRNAAKAYKNPT